MGFTLYRMKTQPASTSAPQIHGTPSLVSSGSDGFSSGIGGGRRRRRGLRRQDASQGPASATVRREIESEYRRQSCLLPVRERRRVIADKDDKVEVEGEIVEALRNSMFRIALDNGHETIGYASGKMRRYRIRVNPGDRVTVELSAYDLTRGRITFRQR